MVKRDDEAFVDRNERSLRMGHDKPPEVSAEGNKVQADCWLSQRPNASTALGRLSPLLVG